MAESRADTVKTTDTGLPERTSGDLGMLDPMRRTVTWGLCAVGAAMLLLIAVGYCRRATVNGRTVPMLRALTVADCARRLDIPLQPGDLLDVSGALLKQGRGTPPIFRANNALVRSDEAVRPGDVVEISPAGDRVEPITQSASFITPVVMTPKGPKPLPWLTQSGVGGIKYVYRGQISGKLQGIVLAAVTTAHGGVPGKPRRLALTFDDGPEPTYTPQILSVLAAHDARATFFVLGCWVPKRPDLVKQAAANGNEIGCHTWSHPNCTKLSNAAIRQQVRRWEAAVEPLIGGRVRYFRPPYGAVNSRVRTVLNSMGYTVVMWTGDTDDWRRPGSNAIYNRAMAAARDGAIILMHDGGGPRSQTVAAVKRMVPDLQAKGYRLVTLSELYGRAGPWADEFIIHTEAGDVKLTPCDEKLKVIINGQAAELPVPPVEIEGQLLLPARPTLQMLGCSVYYNKPAQRLHIDAPVFKMQMDLNRRTMQLGSEEVWMLVPPVFYKGASMVPLWILMDYCGADATYDPTTKTLYLDGEYGRSGRPAPGQGRYGSALDRHLHPALTDKVPWREKLASSF